MTRVVYNDRWVPGYGQWPRLPSQGIHGPIGYEKISPQKRWRGHGVNRRCMGIQRQKEGTEMTEEAIKSFVEKLSTDETFANKLASAPTPEERLKIANDAGFAVNAFDVDGIKAALNIEELSDEDLEKVAGGMGTNTIVSAVTIGMGSAVASAAVVSIAAAAVL